jgi:predicted RNase H-like HicB family nuclease
MNYEFRHRVRPKTDGRWIAEIASLPGVMAYGSTREEAAAKVEALALRIVADQIDRDQTTVEHVQFAMA